MLTRALIEELAEYIEHDEIEAVLAEAKVLFDKWNQVAPNVPDPVQPPKPDVLDGLIRESLVSLSGKGVKSPLTKLAIASVFCFDPHNKLKWDDPSVSAAAAVHIRLGTSSFMLDEFRDLKARKESGDMQMKFVSSSGEVFFRERRFPLWGYEVTHDLSSMDACLDHYRAHLKARRIL